MAVITWRGGDSGGTGDYSTAANWVDGAVPAANDAVVIPAQASYPINDGLDASSVAITSFEVEGGFAYDIGTATEFLQISLTGTGPNYMTYAGTGSRARIDIGASTIAPEVRGSGSPAIGQHAFEIKGTDMTGIDILKGVVGIGVEPDDTTTEVDYVNVSYLTSSGRSSDCDVTIGKDVQANTPGPILNIRQTGGVIRNYADTSQVDCRDAEYRQLDGDYNEGNFSGASTLVLMSTQTYTTTNLFGSTRAVVQGLGSYTFTDISLYAGTSWTDELLQGTYANPIKCPDGIHQTSVNFGPYVDFLPTAI